jgi:hypothetical protein
MVVSACAAMLATAQAPSQTFDVATVKPNPTDKARSNLAISPGMLSIRNLPLRNIIAAAYGIAEYQISGPSGSHRSISTSWPKPMLRSRLRTRCCPCCSLCSQSVST